MTRKHAVLAALLAAASFGAFAHGNEGNSREAGAARQEQKEWGIAGEPKAARRTIEIVMGDNMRFSPDRLQVRQGETVRLVVRNTGRVLHELVLGTGKELQEHAALMAKFPGMEHDEPYMTHVAPGKVGEIVWSFNRAGDFDFACLIPGHFRAGMVGSIRVVPTQVP